MNKFWRVFGIGSIVLIVFAIGVSLVLAQESEESTAPTGPNLTDADGEGLCDDCGAQTGRWNSRGGRRGPGVEGFGDHGPGGWMKRGNSLVGVLAEESGLTVDEVIDEQSGLYRGPLADDWQCSETGVVDGIHIWVSFREDSIPGPDELVAGSVEIRSDVRGDVDLEPLRLSLWQGQLVQLRCLQVGHPPAVAANQVMVSVCLSVKTNGVPGA